MQSLSTEGDGLVSTCPQYYYTTPARDGKKYLLFRKVICLIYWPYFSHCDTFTTFVVKAINAILGYLWIDIPSIMQHTLLLWTLLGCVNNRYHFGPYPEDTQRSPCPPIPVQSVSDRPRGQIGEFAESPWIWIPFPVTCLD